MDTSQKQGPHHIWGKELLGKRVPKSKFLFFQYFFHWITTENVIGTLDNAHCGSSALSGCQQRSVATTQRT